METKYELFRELIELSRAEKRGLTIFIGGQTVAGVVQKIIGVEAIEVKSQMFSRAIVLIDAVDAIAVG
jgi:hypothetical protein